MSKSYLKDPDATLDYQVDWSAWLADGETIQASDWTVPAGLTQASATSDGTSATVWLSGGTAGEDYRVAHRVTTNAGRIDERSFTIRCRER